MFLELSRNTPALVDKLNIVAGSQLNFADLASGMAVTLDNTGALSSSLPLPISPQDPSGPPRVLYQLDNGSLRVAYLSLTPPAGASSLSALVFGSNGTVIDKAWAPNGLYAEVQTRPVGAVNPPPDLWTALAPVPFGTAVPVVQHLTTGQFSSCLGYRTLCNGFAFTPDSQIAYGLADANKELALYFARIGSNGQVLNGSTVTPPLGAMPVSTAMSVRPSST